MFSKTKRFCDSQLNLEFGNKKKVSQPSQRISKSPQRDPPSPSSSSSDQQQNFIPSANSDNFQKQMNQILVCRQQQIKQLKIKKNFFSKSFILYKKYIQRQSRSPSLSSSYKRINEEDYQAKYSLDQGKMSLHSAKRQSTVSTINEDINQTLQDVQNIDIVKKNQQNDNAKRSKNATSVDNPLNLFLNKDKAYGNKENIFTEQEETANNKEEMQNKCNQTLKKFKDFRNQQKSQRISFLGPSYDEDASIQILIDNSGQFENSFKSHQDTSQDQHSSPNNIHQQMNQFSSQDNQSKGKNNINQDIQEFSIQNLIHNEINNPINTKLQQKQDNANKLDQNNFFNLTKKLQNNALSTTSNENDSMQNLTENEQQKIENSKMIVENIPLVQNGKQYDQLQELLKQKEERIQYLEKELQQIKIYYESKDRHQQDYLNNFLRQNLQLQADYQNLKQENENHLKTMDVLKQQLKESERIVEQQHDQIIQFRGNLRIFCRIKPVVEREGNDNQLMIQINQRHKQVVEIKYDENGKYFFDSVFDMNCSQEDVFNQTQPFIQCALNGDQISIIAYGQTGSGKTYTMEGNYDKNNISINSQSGILPRTAVYLFKEKDRVHIHRNLVFAVGVIEVYCEELRDLLQLDEKLQQKLEIVQQNKRIKVLNQTFQTVKSAEELLNVIKKSSQNRITDKTTQNNRSSRSHCIYSIKIYENEIEKGTINIVDLAGSESFQATQNKRESSFINKSLTTLKRIITMLSDRQSLVQSKIPYRESKLTRLLQDSLGGDSKTLIFVTVCPLDENFIQTKESLKFISKATL